MMWNDVKKCVCGCVKEMLTNWWGYWILLYHCTIEWYEALLNVLYLLNFALLELLFAKAFGFTPPTFHSLHNLRSALLLGVTAHTCLGTDSNRICAVSLCQLSASYPLLSVVPLWREGSSKLLAHRLAMLSKSSYIDRLHWLHDGLQHVLSGNCTA